MCSAALKIAQTDKSGEQRVMFTWVIGHQEGKLASAISVPSGVQIPPGMEIKIGDKEARKVGYSICMPDHCEALLPLEETLVKSLAPRRRPRSRSRGQRRGSQVHRQHEGLRAGVADIGK